MKSQGFRGAGRRAGKGGQAMFVLSNSAEGNQEIEIDKHDALEYFSKLNRANDLRKPSPINSSSFAPSSKIPLPVGSKLNNQKARIKKLSSAMVASKYQRNSRGAKQYLTNAYLANNNFSPACQNQMIVVKAADNKLGMQPKS